MLDTLLAPGVLQGAGALLLLFVLGRATLACIDAVRRMRQGRKAHEVALEQLHWRVEREKLNFGKHKEHVELSWDGFRKFEVRRIARNEDRSGHIASFYLYPHDGKPLPSFNPGQFLTFRLRIKGQPREVIRCYSLSDKPHQDHYRVSIKRVPEGLVSGHFHESIREGDIVDVRAPGGRFYLDMNENWPVVLIAGGVGITPVLSMYNAIAAEQPMREVWFLYAARHGDEFIMRDHLVQLAWWCSKANVHFCYSNPNEEDSKVIGEAGGKDERIHHSEGRIGGEFMRRILPASAIETHHFYMCGPPPMMDAVTKDLKDWGVPEAQIHLEAFGAKSVKAGKPKEEPSEAAAPAEVHEVSFSKSGKVVPWDGGSGSLLEFAEKNGVQIEAGCCAGDCHTCATAVKSGKVRYLRDLAEQPEKGTCLPCVAVPDSNLILDA